MLLTIAAAAKARMTIIITYEDSKGNLTAREVEPYEIKQKGKKTFLYAYCIQAEAIRAFETKKIKQVIPTVNRYKPRWVVRF